MSEDDPGRVLRDLPAPEPWNDEEAAVHSLRRTLRDAIDAVPTDGLAIAFSGGVDSAILAALLDAPLFVAGFPDSHDVEAARSGAAALGRDLTTIELSHETLVDAIPRVLTAERVAPEGLKRLAVGQGADELFGGYAKVAKAPEDPRVEADSVAGARREVLAELAEDIDRDLAGIRSAGIEPVCPYLTDAVVEAALRLPGPMLLRKEERK
jgi:asparagine synthase (glutamine-hydrolysing)